MPSRVSYSSEEPYGACGVRLVNDFDLVDDAFSWDDTIEDVQLGQAGLVMAAFIKDDPICQKAYRELKGKFKIVYESRYRINKNSNNMFKLVIYDGLKK